MDAQTLVTVVLIVPAAGLYVVSRRGTSFGLNLRDGALGEFGAGVLFSVPFLAVLGALYPLAGLSETSTGGADIGGIVGIWVYFLVLFALEEVVFRGLLMSGLGPVIGQVGALVVTAVLVAAAYLFAPDTGVGPMIGAVVTNLVHGWARWRSGRIWWGLGQRWFWNSGVVTSGFSDSAFALDHPALNQRLTGPDWLTGGAFGVEGGLVGVLFLVVMGVAVTRFARGREGPWRVQQVR